MIECSIDEKTGKIEHANCVVVFPYFLDSDEALVSVGAVEQDDNLIPLTLKVEKESGFLETAEKFMESNGFSNISNDKWKFLGEFYPTSEFSKPFVCYGVDVSSFEGNDNVKSFDLKTAFAVKNSIFQACFFKLFCLLYKEQLLN